jgi:hypothetical protein
MIAENAIVRGRSSTREEDFIGNIRKNRQYPTVVSRIWPLACSSAPSKRIVYHRCSGGDIGLVFQTELCGHGNVH